MYSYQQCIELCKKDLLSYPKEHLYKLRTSMGLPLFLNQTALAENIAVQLIDKHWKPQRGNMLKDDLPFNGDIQAAMHAQDRDAIRQIQAWRATQQAEQSRSNALDPRSRRMGSAQRTHHRFPN